MEAIEIFASFASAEGRADPYPFYSMLHELGEATALQPGQVVVQGYDAINSVLRDPAFRVADAATWTTSFPGWHEQPVFVQGADWLLNLNGPDHARIRSLIARAFTARRISGLEPAIVEDGRRAARRDGGPRLPPAPRSSSCMTSRTSCR